MKIYRNNLKNRESGKECPQNLHLERATIARRQGASENASFEATTTPLETDFSSCFGIILQFLLISCCVCLEAAPSHSLKALYDSLDPLSVTEHLAFYEVYSESPEGKKALNDAWRLLTRGDPDAVKLDLSLPKVEVQAVVSLVTRQSFDPPVKLNEKQLGVIEKISAHLGNRKLKGSSIWTKKELLDLESGQIDLARGLLINQFDTVLDPKEDIRQYEASL